MSETAAKTATDREVVLNGSPELQARNTKQKGEMNMKKQLLSVAAAVAMCSAVALGQGGPGGPMAGAGMHSGMHMQGRMGGGRLMPRFHRVGMGQWWRNPRVAQQLGLSEQQQQQLEKISQDARLKMIDRRADLEREQVLLQPMMQTYHPDEAQVLAQVEKVSLAKAALQKERVQAMLATQNVLTEEQWNKLKAMRMSFHHRSFRRGGLGRRPMMPQKPMPPTPPSN